MATEIIEGPAVAAEKSTDAGATPPLASPVAARVSGTLRAHRREVILLAVVAGCVIAFAAWLDATLRPALAAREHGQFADTASVRHGAAYSNAPPESCAASHLQWCGEIGVMAARGKPMDAAGAGIGR